MPGPRPDLLDKLLPYPFARKVVYRLGLIEKKPSGSSRYGFILGFDEYGKLTHNLQTHKGSYSDITNTVPFRNKLYLGSIYRTSIGVYELPASKVK